MMEYKSHTKNMQNVLILKYGYQVFQGNVSPAYFQIAPKIKYTPHQCIKKTWQDSNNCWIWGINKGNFTIISTF